MHRSARRGGRGPTPRRAWATLLLLCYLLACLGCAHPSAVTATAPGIDGHLAVLGGTPAAFTATYGAPVLVGQGYQYTTSTGVGVFLWDNVAVTPVGDRVAQLYLEPTDHQPWDASTEGALYTAFFPPDAVHLQDVGTASGKHHL